MYTHTDGRKFPTGAIPSPKVEGVPFVGKSSTPYDWSTTTLCYDPVVKDQGQSSSCGGNATAYKEELNNKIPQSAKSIYSLCFVPGGGSSEPGLWNVISNTGIATEANVPSIPNTEASFEDTTWNRNLSIKTNKNIVYVNLDIESIAEAVRDNNGVILGISGYDNGTWLSTDPVVPIVPISQCWCHWVICRGAIMRNGVKTLVIKNSWGSQAGAEGTQFLSENYLPYIWSAWTYSEIPNSFKFTKLLKYGMTDPDVGKLQTILGLSNPTNYFGRWTLINLLYFQLKNGLPLSGKVDLTTQNFLNLNSA